jgi:hypothetical protein
MSTTEELQRDCAYCRQPITLKWENGQLRSEGARLVFDQFFHDKCWDKFLAGYHGKEARPRGTGATPDIAEHGADVTSGVAYPAQRAH